jgi:glycosyltransferase involved in cell wall biosynthesis
MKPFTYIVPSVNSNSDKRIEATDHKKQYSWGDNTPLISIGLPTYNGETFLRQALDSLLAQEYKNFEIIISDNASTDGAAAICREYAGKDARIKFFANDENRGAAYNFLKVLALASGKYFMWASDHDLWRPTLLAKALAVLENDPGVVLCYPRAERVDVHGRSLGLAANTMDTRGMSAVERFMYLLNNISGGDMICGLIRLEALRSLDPQTVWGADQAILAGLALQGTFAHLPETLFFWRQIRDESLDYRKKTVPLTLDPKDSQGMLAMSLMELWRQLGEECLALVSGSSLPEAEKEKLVRETKSCFTRRYGVTWPASSTPAEFTQSPEKTGARVLPATCAAPPPSAPDLPLVSVIVPTYNRPDMLVAALQSLLHQTYKHYEIIVVNDCGIGVDHIVDWLNQQGDMTYVRHDRHRGSAAARNTGLKLSRGKYVAYLDDAEIFYPDHLENLVTSLEGRDFHEEATSSRQGPDSH